MAKVWLSGHRILRRVSGVYSAGSFRILLFHHISREQMAAFERLLRYVLDVHGIITPEQADGLLAGGVFHNQHGRVPYLLTFDDGFQSHGNVAKEILDQYGVKAIFFVCPGLIDVPREHQRDAIARFIFDGRVRGIDLPDEMAIMSWADLDALVASGHTIGSHTSLHRRLARLSKADQEQEITGAAVSLEQRLGVKVNWFAYPFGDLFSVDQRSLHTIAKHHQFCCSGIRGVNSASNHPLALLREQLDPVGPFDYQQLVVEGGLDIYYRIRARRLQGLVTQATAQASEL
jgi:peptidoglycan/xylan/chitin deacetylase (PgdA/CDA1 family)